MPQHELKAWYYAGVRDFRRIFWNICFKHGYVRDYMQDKDLLSAVPPVAKATFLGDMWPPQAPLSVLAHQREITKKKKSDMREPSLCTPRGPCEKQSMRKEEGGIVGKSKLVWFSFCKHAMLANATKSRTFTPSWAPYLINLDDVTNPYHWTPKPLAGPEARLIRMDASRSPPRIRW